MNYISLNCKICSDWTVMEPHFNEDLGTHENDLVIRYTSNLLYYKVPLYHKFCSNSSIND